MAVVIKTTTMNTNLNKNGLTEDEFLALYKTKNYQKPSLTVDIIVIRDNSLLLIKRGNHPFINTWALPGGFSNFIESVEESAKRELKEETNLDSDNLTLVGVYSSPGRDKRGWVVSTAFSFLLEDEQSAVAGDDAAATAWFTISLTSNCVKLTKDEICIEFGYKDNKANSCSTLAFDHNQMILDALLQHKTGY